MSFAFAFGGGAAAGSVSARAVSVPAGTAGRVATLGRLLGSASTISLRSGTNSNISIDNGDGISLGAGLAIGASQLALIREQKGSGNDIVAVEYPLSITGAAPTPTPGPGTAAPGATATTFSVAPVAQWHPNTSAITADANGRMTQLVDLKGFADIFEASAGIGPFVRTDGLGRKFLRLTGTEAIRYAEALALNLRNCAVMFIARNHRNGPTNPKWMFSGKNSDGTAVANSQVAYFSQASGGRATVIGSGTSGPNRPYMLADCHVRAYMWNYRANGAAGAANVGLRLSVNGFAETVALSGTAPPVIGGGEIGRNAYTPGVSGTWPILDVYEIIVWGRGLTDAEHTAAISAAMTNYGMNNADNVAMVEGDSRMFGFSYAGSPNGFDSGENPAMLMTDPGNPLAIPDTWAVMNAAVSYSSIPAGTGAGGTNNQTYRRDIADSWSTQRRSGRNVVIWLNGGNNFKLSPALTGAQTYAAQTAWMNTDVTGSLQRGWENVLVTEMQLDSTLYTPMLELRAAQMNTAQLQADTLSGPGQIYEGKVRVAPIHLITVGGKTVCGSPGDELNTNYYLISTSTGQVDATHPTKLLNQTVWSGGDTPQYGIRAALNL